MDGESGEEKRPVRERPHWEQKYGSKRIGCVSCNVSASGFDEMEEEKMGGDLRELQQTQVGISQN